MAGASSENRRRGSEWRRYPQTVLGRLGAAAPTAGGYSIKGAPLHDEFLSPKELSDAVAQVALELDRVLRHGAAGAARTLDLLTELGKKGGITRKSGHYGDGLPVAPLLFDAQLRHDRARPGRNGVRRAGATLAIPRRPTARRAHAADVGRVDEPPLPAIIHPYHC